MKKTFALILAVMVLLVAFGAPAEEEGRMSPLFATVGEALDAAGKNPVAGNDADYYAVVTEKDGVYYRSVAEMDDRARELQAAVWQADPEHARAASTAAKEYEKTLPIIYSEQFTAFPMAQADLDALVGKTIGDLREAGYEDTESGMEDEDIVYAMQNGLYEYSFAVDVDYDTYEKMLEEELDDSDYVIKSATFRCVSGNACFLEYHADGTVGEIQDPFEAYEELVGAFQELIEETQNGEEVDIEAFASDLREQYPDLTDMIDLYISTFQLLGADGLAEMMTPEE